MKNPLLQFVFLLATLTFRATRCFYTSPQPYNLSYVVRLLSNGQPDPAYTNTPNIKWVKNGNEIGDGSFADWLQNSRPYSEPGYYELVFVYSDHQEVRWQYDVNYPCPTPPTSSDETARGDSWSPSINGVDGGDGEYCIAGMTGWMSGPFVFDFGMGKTSPQEFDFYVATHCDADHDGNATNNGDNYAVNFSPYKLTIDRRAL